MGGLDHLNAESFWGIDPSFEYGCGMGRWVSAKPERMEECSAAVRKIQVGRKTELPDSVESDVENVRSFGIQST